MTREMGLGSFDSAVPVKLEIDLFPRTAVCKSLREVLPQETWDRIRRQTYIRSRYTCQHCRRRKSDQVTIYAVAEWEFSEESIGGYRLQKLKGMVTVCSNCFALKRLWPGEEALTRLAEVWKIPVESVADQIELAFERTEELSRVLWALDLSWLEDKGFSLELSDPCTRVVRDGIVMGEA